MPPRPEPAALPRRAQLERAWLFWMALLLGGFLAVYAPLQFGRMAAAARDAGEAASAVAMAGLALLTLFTGTRWCVLLVLALARVNRAEPLQGAAPVADAALPFVSILMPAYAEEECIEAALGSLLALDYPAYEIVMVDDGSPDRTLELARPFAGPHRTAHGSCELRVFTKPNGGKWSAHNFGLKRARGELILCIDADSRLDPLSLRRLVRRLDNPQVAAVAGQIRVRNREGLLTRLQALEYVIANGTYRLAQSATGTVMVVPGPIGLFRRDVLDEVMLRFPQPPGMHGVHGASWAGPFSDATFAEDFHLSLAVLMLGYAIDYEPLAVSHTRSPDSIRTLLNQRYRWNRGTLQVLRWFFGEARAGRVVPKLRLGLWTTLTLAWDSLLQPLIQLAMLGALIHYFLSGANLELLAAWAASAWMLNILAGSFFLLVHEDELPLLALAPLFDLYQGVLLGGAWFIAAVDELRGTAMRW